MKHVVMAMVMLLVGCKQEPKAPAVIEQKTAPTEAKPQIAEPAAPQAPVDITNPADIFEKYESNEIAADNKFKGKPVRTVGIIAGIRKDAFDKAYVDIAAKPPFGLVLHFADETLLAELKKGQLIHVECVGRGAVMRIPVLNDCKLLWAEPDVFEPLATQLAASYEICAIDQYANQYHAAIDAGHPLKGDGDASAKEVLQFMMQSRKPAVNALAKINLPQLACDDAMMFPLSDCDGSHSAPQCSSKLIVAARRHFHH